jgi:hypothetical protein
LKGKDMEAPIITIPGIAGSFKTATIPINRSTAE